MKITLNDEKRKFLEQTGKQLLIESIISQKTNQLVFVFDWTDRLDAKIYFLNGSFKQYGIEAKDQITINALLKLIDLDNPIAKIYGEENYLFSMRENINRLTKLEELNLPFKTKSGTIWVTMGLEKVTSKNGYPSIIIGFVHWVSMRVPKAILYYQQKYRDSQTELLTKDSLSLHLRFAEETSHSYGIYFDIDNFKRVNDVFGHRAGDRYLVQLAKELKKLQTQNERYYRLGGDEFFVYLTNITEQAARKKAMDIIYIVEHLNEEGQQVEVSASIGIIPIIGSQKNVEELIDLADRTMYRSKEKGKGNISYSREV